MPPSNKINITVGHKILQIWSGERGEYWNLRFWASLLCSNHQATYVTRVRPGLLHWALGCWSWNSESSFSFASSCETPPVGGTEKNGGQENGLALPFCFQFCEHHRSRASSPSSSSWRQSEVVPTLAETASSRAQRHQHQPAASPKDQSSSPRGPSSKPLGLIIPFFIPLCP